MPRAISSVGQSASFTPRMSGVRVPHRPPDEQTNLFVCVGTRKTERCDFLKITASWGRENLERRREIIRGRVPHRPQDEQTNLFVCVGTRKAERCDFFKSNCRGSSVVERSPEEAGVGGSIPSRGTSSNLFGIKNMERFCGSQNRTLIFAKPLSAYGGSRKVPQIPPSVWKQLKPKLNVFSMLARVQRKMTSR